MRISEPTPELIRHVAANMRARDFAEFSAVSFAETRDELAGFLARSYGNRSDVTVGLTEDGEAACVGATIMARPNVVTLLFFATDRFPEIAFPATRFIKKQLFPRLEEQGVHRIEAVSLAGYDEAHGWLNTLGLRRETDELRGYGKAGEAFVQFSWVKDDHPPRA